jgi:hypothetical protein
MKKRIDEQREMDKKMFQILKSNKTLLREFQDAPSLETDAPEVSDEVADEEEVEGEKGITPSESDVIEQQEKFRQTVAADTQFTSFTILPDEGNVIFSGTIPGICDFVFDLNQREGYGFKTQSQITMTNQTAEILKTMNAYFENWRGEMFDKLREYQQGQSDG